MIRKRAKTLLRLECCLGEYPSLGEAQASDGSLSPTAFRAGSVEAR